jgi:hypothetical protein
MAEDVAAMLMKLEKHPDFAERNRRIQVYKVLLREQGSQLGD